MKRRLVFATNNKNKLREIRELMPEYIEVLSLADIDCVADIPETAETLEGNALIKAHYVYDHYGLDCFADDTGLEVDALGGQPGVHTARYAGEENDPSANMQKLLREMKENSNRHDINNNQTIIINKNVMSLNRVNADGTTTPSPTMNDTINLAPGDYILYQWTAERDNVQAQTAILNSNSIVGQSSAYRDDTTGVILTRGENLENGFALDNMGDYNWKQYTLGLYKTSAKRIVSRAQAIKNWGSWFKYDVVADQDMYVNIYMKHAVKWQDYGLVVSTGSAPGSTYVIDGSTTLNWPKQYAASMMLALDGVTLKPNQISRPVAPYVYEEDGSTFNSILANKSNWTSTQVNGLNNDTLWFWPEAGGDNTPISHYNAQPDYLSVHLSQGLHTFTLTSMCSPWIFDCIKFEDVQNTGINNIMEKNPILAYGSKGSITILANYTGAIYSVSGICMAKGSGTIKLPAGVYIVKIGDQVQRVLVR